MAQVNLQSCEYHRPLYILLWVSDEKWLHIFFLNFANKYFFQSNILLAHTFTDKALTNWQRRHRQKEREREGRIWVYIFPGWQVQKVQLPVCFQQNEFLQKNVFHLLMYLFCFLQTELSHNLQQLSEKAKSGSEFIQRLKTQTEKINVSSALSPFHFTQFSFLLWCQDKWKKVFLLLSLLFVVSKSIEQHKSPGSLYPVNYESLDFLPWLHVFVVSLKEKRNGRTVVVYGNWTNLARISTFFNT